MKVINRTPMLAEPFIAMDKAARQHFALVVKGTFAVDAQGNAAPAAEQVPFKYADEHYGDPAATSIRYESDFAPVKPAVDVLLNGHAHAPAGREVAEIGVSLEIGPIRKNIRVVGDRIWQKRLFWTRATKPAPFTKMPLVYERAFGGADLSDDNPKKHRYEQRNLVGVGLHSNSAKAAILGKPLPNLEHPDAPVRRWKDKVASVGFGSVGRGWLPRITWGGTYDQKWIDERFPFLPHDFDERYYMSAPADQVLPSLSGGEQVRCVNMRPDGAFKFTIPKMPLVAFFVFDEHHVEIEPKLDTLLIEPDETRFILTWRASIPVRGKLHDLQQIVVGPPSVSLRRSVEKHKMMFASLAEYLSWREEQMLARE